MDNLENRVRRAVRLRMKRGQQQMVAEAAGHDKGSWVSNWLAGRQKHATIDEMAAMLKALDTSIQTVVGAPTAADVDWQAFGLMGALKTPEAKQDALLLLRGLVDDAVFVVSQSPSGTGARRLKMAGTRRR